MIPLELQKIIVATPDTIGGIPRFAGTRVPLRNLLDYIAAGDSLDVFLDHFPTVSKEQARAVLNFTSIQ